MKLISIALITGTAITLAACGSNPPQSRPPSASNPVASPQSSPPAYAPPYTLRGSVYGKDNRPVGNIVVELIPNQCFQKTQATVRTDPLGRYKFSNVLNGQYVLGLNGFSSAGGQNKNPKYKATCSDKHTVDMNARPGGVGIVRDLRLQSQ